MRVLESELFGYFLDPLGEEKVDFAKSLGVDTVGHISEHLARFLLENNGSAEGQYSVETVELPTQPTFKSILYQSTDKNLVVAFNFKQSFNECGLSLIGLIVSVFVHHPSALDGIEGLKIIKALWDNLTVLKSPQDADAIQILRALALKTAQNKMRGFPSPEWNDVADMVALPPKEARSALDTLYERKVIMVARWGRQVGDIGHPNNVWEVSL